MQALSLPQMLSNKWGFASRVIGKSAARHLKRASSAASLSEGSAFLNHTLKVIMSQFVWKICYLLWSTVYCPHEKCGICNPGVFCTTVRIYSVAMAKRYGKRDSCLNASDQAQVTGEGRKMRFGFSASFKNIFLTDILMTGEYLFPHFPKLGWAVGWCLFITSYTITNILSSAWQPSADFQSLVCSVGVLFFSTFTERQMISARAPLSLEVVKPWSMSS